MRGKHLRDEEADERTEAVRVETDSTREAPLVADSVDDGIVAAHRRFGGFDLPAALAGTLAGLGLTVLLAGLAGAAGSIGYRQGTDVDDLSTGGLVTGMVVLLAAFLVGGWVAGRMARYDGVLNGMSSGVLFVLLVGGVAAAGAWADERYDFFADVNLPQWFTGASDAEAVGSAVLGIALVLLASALGGAAGSRYHRRADTLLAGAAAQSVHGGRPGSLERSEVLGRRAVR